MPTFSGKFQYNNSDGFPIQAGLCKVTVEKQDLMIVPTSGAPLAMDLGDIDVFLPAEYELSLTLYTGKQVRLNQFGKTFQNLCHDLLEAYRKRLLECLLLEDLEEITRFDGFARLESPTRAFSSPAEFRLYRSNLAVLPTQATGFQWRLVDIDNTSFDEATYTTVLTSGAERLVVTKLAKRTQEFSQRLEEATSEVREKGAEALREVFPFASPDQFQQFAELLREGHSAPLGKLHSIHPKAKEALATNVIDPLLKPYFQALEDHTAEGLLSTGFKLLRKDEGEDKESEDAEADSSQAESPAGEAPPAEEAESAGQEAAAAPESPAPEDAEAQPRLHWFFFPLAAKQGAKTPGNLVAWEATSKSGRATYFFRLVPPEQAKQLQDSSKAPALVDAAVRDLNRAILLLNFRREPIYLPDNSLEIQPRYRRYAIACRKIPELRRLRSAFLGRAIHTSFQTWQKQVDAFLARA